jgi:hypothetical protein
MVIVPPPCDSFVCRTQSSSVAIVEIGFSEALKYMAKARGPNKASDSPASMSAAAKDADFMYVAPSHVPCQH